MDPRSDQQGVPPRVLALPLGHAGLVHARPAEGLPADLTGGPDSFIPGSVEVPDFASAESEQTFLQAAIAMQPPALQSQLRQMDPQPAACLSPAAAEQFRQHLGQPAVFTAGRLFDRRDAWLSELDPPAYVRRWLADGYSEYLPQPVTWVCKPNNPSTQRHEAFVTEQLQELVTNQSVVDVTHMQHDRMQVAAILPLTVAEPDVRKMRLCWNGGHVNDVLLVPTFKMEHAPKAASILRPGDYLFTVDMKSGYHQIPLKPSFRRYCCFQWQGRGGCSAAVAAYQPGGGGPGAAHPVLQDRSGSGGTVFLPAQPSRPQHLPSALPAAAVRLHTCRLSWGACFQDSSALCAAAEESHRADPFAPPLAALGLPFSAVWPALTAEELLRRRSSRSRRGSSRSTGAGPLTLSGCTPAPYQQIVGLLQWLWVRLPLDSAGAA